MPTCTIQSIETFYIQKGNGPDVVCLYGWGQDTRMFEPTLNRLSDRFRVTVFDFPGFGKTGLMQSVWSVDDYVNWMIEIFKQLDIEKPILIAHSFGARLAIKYASEHEVAKLVLTGAAGLIPKRSLKYHVKVQTYKMLKKISQIPLLKPLTKDLTKHFGSDDYKALSGVLRQTFVKIVNEDLRPYLPKIKAPTLLIWGEFDDATPLWMGKVMEKEIPDAGLVIFEKDDHYAYWNQLDRFHTIVDVFLKEETKHG